MFLYGKQTELVIITIIIKVIMMTIIITGVDVILAIHIRPGIVLCTHEANTALMKSSKTLHSVNQEP